MAKPGSGGAGKEPRADLAVLDQGIDTSIALGRMFFHILGAIEFEHALMSERTMSGLAAARARAGGQKPTPGRRPGRPRPADVRRTRRRRPTPPHARYGADQGGVSIEVVRLG